MGHCIRAILGNSEKINALAESWSRKPIQLSQGLSMLFLTDDLFDDVTESVNVDNEIEIVGFNYFTSAIAFVLAEHTQNGKLAYFETEYFGGSGTQTAILYEKGKPKFPAIFTDDTKGKCPAEKRAINMILKEFNVLKLNEKDEFDSIGLGNFRRMDE